MKKQSKGKWFVLALGALLALCIGCAAVKGITDALTEGYMPLAVQAPATIALPTRVPPTPVPVNAAPDYGGNDITYGNLVQVYMEDLAGNMDTMQGLMYEAGDDGSVLFDDSWNAAVRQTGNTLKGNCRNVVALNPGPLFEVVHVKVQSACRHWSAGIDYLFQGIDSMDSDALESSVRELRLGTADIETATSLIPSLP